MLRWLFLGAAVLLGVGLAVFAFVNFQPPHAVSQPAATTVNLTIPEGASVGQIAQLAHAQNITPRSKVLALNMAREFRETYPFLPNLLEDASLEGYLFPDTYAFSENTAAREFIGPLLANFKKRVVEGLATELAAAKRPLLEILTVASFLEKEVSSKADRRLVAGVIYNRLKLNLPLELDSTIVYISGNASGVFDRGEKLIDSPYNTFRNRGLPPGPIGNPGTESIEAALEPTASDYLYFLTDSQGIVHFNTTLEGHYIDRAKFLE